MELVFLIIFNRIYIFVFSFFGIIFLNWNRHIYIYINGFDITFLFLIIQKLYAKRFPIFSIFIKHLAKQIESISKSYWKEKAHTRVPRKLFSTFPFIIIIYISLILSFTIFIELLAQTDRTSRYPVTGKGRKHTILSYSFDRQYSQYSYFLAITCIYQPRHANGSNSMSITGEKERTFFSFFSIFHGQLKIVQKGGNRWHRNFAYLRGSAQKAIICEITRTNTCIKLNIQTYMC